MHEGSCNTTRPQKEASAYLDSTPQWECEPNESLCGMIQPLVGSRDWVYVQHGEYEIPLMRKLSPVLKPKFKN